jgi:hypothetical protein
MPLGVCRLNRRILLLVIGLWVSTGLTSCGGGFSVKKPTSGLTMRVLASQGTTATTDFGGLVYINGEYDTLARVQELSAGTSPGLMAISPNREIVAAFDSGSNSVYSANTASESSGGRVQLPGATFSMAVPTASGLAFAAVPSATVTGYSFLGAVDYLNISSGSIIATIAVPNAQTIVANSDGSQILAFSNSSNPVFTNSVIVLSPTLATPPVDTSCLTNPPNAVCTIVPGFDHPVYAIINGTTAYIFNCGPECGGTQASIQTLDLGSFAVGTPLPVNGATWGLLSGTTLYVAGNGTPTGQPCASLPLAAPTAAPYCGTLDIINLNTMTDPYYNNPAVEIAMPDGYHWRMDMSVNGQLFVGSKNCTNIGNVNNPSGEVRGCLAIYNTTNNTVIFPPDNGDVLGLQSFTSRNIEYVAEGGALRVYNTNNALDVLLINDYVPEGTINVLGYVGDVKAIDFF